MNNIQLYIITVPITAFITCAFIIMFMSKIKMKPELRMTIVFVVYAIFAFVMGAGGNGIFNLDVSSYCRRVCVLWLVSVLQAWRHCR